MFMSSIYPLNGWNCYVFVTKVDENVYSGPMVETIIVVFWCVLKKSVNILKFGEKNAYMMFMRASNFFGDV